MGLERILEWQVGKYQGREIKCEYERIWGSGMENENENENWYGFHKRKQGLKIRMKIENENENCFT